MKLFFTLLFLTMLQAFGQKNCDDINISTDNRTGSTKFEHPITFDMQYSKTVSKNGDTTYNLYLQTVVSYTNSNEKGCIVYLSDGSKLEFPEQQVVVTYLGLLRIKYSAILTLSAAEISKLLGQDIVDFRLYIHNSTVRTALVKKKNAKVVSDYLKCLVTGARK